MPKLLRYLGHRLYTTWATFWFVSYFFVTYPLMLVLVRRPAWQRYLHGLNRNWAKFSFILWGVSLEIIRENTQPIPQPCIYVANHGSYIDIMVLFHTVPGFLNMMGKESLAKFPLWGPLFGKTYIPVNRRSVVSRGRAIALARQGLKEGRPLAMFPEGTIGPKPGEELLPFQDGAFQLAISLGVPVVPVSMPLNHRFMPSVAGLRVRHAKLRVVFHEAIETKGLTEADVPALKAQVMAQIADDFVPEGRGIPEPSTWR
ncbi:lysophospholipid acyltransferase family protein [Hymenobacter psoromatis]|uniref:lysophospholipid acyltransferase family protein n=1 Tax=Hymenobacter psoromatis TaxID=1484116 RepID=UPI001CBBC998|nr:lysophospholipid acyltransferase family protein [Hymenobacter psoromatis]